MTRTQRKSLNERQKEMLVVMTALLFIEENSLMSDAQLNDAKRSIQALFISSSSEETLLRTLIEKVKVNRDLRQGFSEISKISSRISTSVEILNKKLIYLKQYFGRVVLTPEENEDFVEPFMRFSSRFHAHVVRFDIDMQNYLVLRETEAKREHDYRIAQDASERLRQRLSGSVGADRMSPHEQTLQSEAIGTFNYEETRRRLEAARKECKAMTRQITSLLADLKGMCQMAMNPDMRDTAAADRAEDLDCEDIFAHFTTSLKLYPRLQHVREFVIDYFRLYQRAYGLLQIDYENFERAIESIALSPNEYFDAKEEDEDIRLKLGKLKKYEGLIPFLDAAHEFVDAETPGAFSEWSREYSLMISDPRAAWAQIGESLLVAKVSAESDLTTRLHT